jgi:DNA invertase Pin-like site-specific DNA recombinase
MPRKPNAFVAYLRVSTARQGESGLGLDAQSAAVEAFARQHGGTIIASHIEIESGKRSDRPELAQALAAARKGQGDAVNRQARPAGAQRGIHREPHGCRS